VLTKGKMARFNLKILKATILFLVIWSIPRPVAASTVLNTLIIPDSRTYRILPGNQDEYWVCDARNGLIKLTEDQQGNWLYNQYDVGFVEDATGPDSFNHIYLSYWGGGGNAGVCVFDCNSLTVIGNLTLGADYVITGITLSADGSKLFVLGWDWPRIAEPYSESDAIAHPDSGIIWVIDTTTLQIIDQNSTVEFPYTIFYAEPTNQSLTDALIVSCAGTWHIPGGIGRLSTVDIHDTVCDLPQLAEIITDGQVGWYTNDIIKWSNYEPLVAVLGADVTQNNNWTHYGAAVWVINSESRQIVQRLTITDSIGLKQGIRHAVISECNPGVVYGSMSGLRDTISILAFDQYSGALIQEIPAIPGFYSEFIYELCDGRLIVTGGDTGKILIIDPT
jgi:hypothetical protein